MMKSNHGSRARSLLVFCKTWNPYELSGGPVSVWRAGAGSPSRRPMNRFKAPNMTVLMISHLHVLIQSQPQESLSLRRGRHVEPQSSGTSVECSRRESSSNFLSRNNWNVHSFATVTILETSPLAPKPCPVDVSVLVRHRSARDTFATAHSRRAAECPPQIRETEIESGHLQPQWHCE